MFIFLNNNNSITFLLKKLFKDIIESGKISSQSQYIMNIVYRYLPTCLVLSCMRDIENYLKQFHGHSQCDGLMFD